MVAVEVTHLSGRSQVTTPQLDGTIDKYNRLTSVSATGTGDHEVIFAANAGAGLHRFEPASGLDRYFIDQGEVSLPLNI